MRKYISIILILFFSSFINAQTKVPIATLTMSIGDVFVKRIMKKTWEAGHIGSSIYSGDRVKTKESGKVEVTFNDGSVVFLGNDSEIEFIDQDEKKPKNSLFLFFGNLQNKVNKGANYEVETVHALATVKGTEFQVKSDENQMEVSVFSGTVLVQNEFGKQRVSKGKKSNITSKTKPTIKRMSKSEVKSFTFNTIKASYFTDLKLPEALSQKKWILFTGTIKNEFDEKITEILTLQIQGSSGILMSKNGKDSSQKINIDTENGSFSFYIKSGIETGTVSIISDKTETVSYYLDFKAEEKTRKIFIQFKDKDGNIKKAEATFEKKN